MPVETPTDASHSTSAENGAPTGTSTNVGVAVGVKAGEPECRYRNAAIAWRLTLRVGSKRRVPSGWTVPVVTPVHCEPPGYPPVG